jgi:LacI family transcriptional regulator
MEHRAPAPRPTMAGVAKHAGVSLKTVSRVVNGEPYVSDPVAERVRASIAALGFRRDGSARQLARRTAGPIIGYVQVDAANPFFGAVARGLEEVTREHGYLVLTGSTDADPAREGRLLETLVEARVAGIVVAAAEGGDDLLRDEVQHGTAIVCVDRPLEGVHCDTVTSTNRASTREAVARLLDRGHRHIAFLGGAPSVWTASERRAGFADALADAGLQADPELVVERVDSAELAADATVRLLDATTPPTAVFAAQDRIGLGVVRALHEAGVQHQVALVVFDDLPLAAQLEPPVATIVQDALDLGRTAGRLLIERLETRADLPPRYVEVPARFVDRASAAIGPP